MYAYVPSAKQALLCRTLCAIADDDVAVWEPSIPSRIGALSREIGKEKSQELFTRRVRDFDVYTQSELRHQKEGLFGTVLVRDR